MQICCVLCVVFVSPTSYDVFCPSVCLYVLLYDISISRIYNAMLGKGIPHGFIPCHTTPGIGQKQAPFQIRGHQFNQIGACPFSVLLSGSLTCRPAGPRQNVIVIRHSEERRGEGRRLCYNMPTPKSRTTLRDKLSRGLVMLSPRRHPA